MEFDHSKLAGRITEKFGSQAALADYLGWPASKLSNRMLNKVQFSPDEMILLSEPRCLDIPPQDYVVFFLTPKF